MTPIPIKSMMLIPIKNYDSYSYKKLMLIPIKKNYDSYSYTEIMVPVPIRKL